MDAKCPGSDMRAITADEVTCPNCGSSVELFSDERMRRCPSCGERVAREAAPACAEWCSAAASCLGTERYQARAASGQTGDTEETDG